MTEALVEAAVQLFVGQGLDAALAHLRTAGTIAAIKALREVTGLDLRDAVAALEAAKEGRSLAHLTAGRLALLVRARRAGGGWWSSLYCDAQFADAPWLTIARGREVPGMGAVHLWTDRAEPLAPKVEDAYTGSISGPGVSYDGLRAELHEAVARDPFWREHVELVRDGEHALVCRFSLWPPVGVSESRAASTTPEVVSPARARKDASRE